MEPQPEPISRAKPLGSPQSERAKGASYLDDSWLQESCESSGRYAPPPSGRATARVHLPP